MKKTVFAISAAVLAAVVSCGPKPQVTTISGEFLGDAPETVTIKLQESKFDSTIVVRKGKFSVDVPTDITLTGRITSEAGNVTFIPDGTPLKVVFSGDEKPEAVSLKPKNSLQEAYRDYSSWLEDLSSGYSQKYASIRSDESLSAEDKEKAQEELIDAMDAEIVDRSLELLDANKDNYLAVLALSNVMYNLPDAQLDSLLSVIDPEIAAKPSLASAKKAITARASTAEGMKFTDFEIVQPDQSVRKLSDYVGKGKYTLVDFWASWCGPCKREIPNLKNVYEKYHGKDFDIVSVAVWDKVEASIDTAAAYGIKWDQILDCEKVPTDIYGIQGIPHIILFGPDGTILKRDLRGSGIEEEIARYVKPVK